jgi:hypothetical protein
MTLQPNDSYYRFRMPIELKRQFQQVCKKKNIKPAEFFRQQAEKLVKEAEHEKVEQSLYSFYLFLPSKKALEYKKLNEEAQQEL